MRVEVLPSQPQDYELISLESPHSPGSVTYIPAILNHVCSLQAGGRARAADVHSASKTDGAVGPRPHPPSGALPPPSLPATRLPTGGLLQRVAAAYEILRAHV